MNVYTYRWTKSRFIYFSGLPVTANAGKETANSAPLTGMLAY